MTEPDDIEMTAAEYVIGTLDVAERRAVDARRLNDVTLDAAIGSWERRLAPLLDEVAPVEPPAGLYQRIERRIAADPSLTPSVGAAGLGAHTNVVVLERQIARWRRLAYGMTALAASLLVALAAVSAWTLYGTQRDPSTFVAVFQKDDKQPAFLMSVDLKTREMTIRAITADRQVGKAYQLWILAEPLGPTPKSLGLLEASLEPTRKKLTEFDPALLQKATFGISVEPPGGSPIGKPTGPALHGTLHVAAP